MPKIHLIAIGGAAMHNMALSLHEKGFDVTGSDDEINEPSKSRLAKKSLLPEKMGWFPEKITKNIDAVILGMHAREDNPELIKARELGLRIYSYPEYIYEATKEKTRIVIGGSHGKTTITAMILHAMKFAGIDCDYMVGAQLEGFDTMVKLSNTAKFAVIEGDEYLASPIDRRPKFHLYKPNIAIISGIAWDHINVFPTFENYLEQFRKFIRLIEPGGALIYCEVDNTLHIMCESDARTDIKKYPYAAAKHKLQDGVTSLLENGKEIPIEIFGMHNLMNLNAARLACREAGITETVFNESMRSFKGASGRLQLVSRSSELTIFRDFAHSPSKLQATTKAVKAQFPGRNLVACMELHTFSSLNEEFLRQYTGCMNDAGEAIVYFNPRTIEHKKLKPITESQVKESFGREDLKVFTDSVKLKEYLHGIPKKNMVLLLMSSGTFDGLKPAELAG
jgi:UDP-N-acetylmuramate: L-alanyl-gamma-D-glutamyl-meso-diaminopimelate ligase